jgi:hypothetical protein
MFEFPGNKEGGTARQWCDHRGHFDAIQTLAARLHAPLDKAVRIRAVEAGNFHQRGADEFVIDRMAGRALDLEDDLRIVCVCRTYKRREGC